VPVAPATVVNPGSGRSRRVRPLRTRTQRARQIQRVDRLPHVSRRSPYRCGPTRDRV